MRRSRSRCQRGRERNRQALARRGPGRRRDRLGPGGHAQQAVQAVQHR
ncbi:hypothetical protein HMPREF0731_2304, partial [Pseudoroseomonas cervicalis ATCC 49957]